MSQRPKIQLREERAKLYTICWSEKKTRITVILNLPSTKHIPNLRTCVFKVPVGRIPAQTLIIIGFIWSCINEKKLFSPGVVDIWVTSWRFPFQKYPETVSYQFQSADMNSKSLICLILWPLFSQTFLPLAWCESGECVKIFKKNLIQQI